MASEIQENHRELVPLAIPTRRCGADLTHNNSLSKSSRQRDRAGSLDAAIARGRFNKIRRRKLHPFSRGDSSPAYATKGYENHAENSCFRWAESLPKNSNSSPPRKSW